MFKRRENIFHRVLERQISRSPPSSHVNRTRHFYENIVPNFTLYDVDCPDHYFRKFSNDGQYLICLSRSYQHVIVYRHKWLTFCIRGDNSDCRDEIPPGGKKFESHFSLLYSVNLASGNEWICKDFFIETECNSFGIFATATAIVSDNEAPVTPGTVPGVPSIDRITFYLVRLADGMILDERTFQNDFIHLAYNMGVFLYGDLLAVLSARYQSIHILQVRETGIFVDVRTIGTFCREDDELILNAHEQVARRALETSCSSKIEADYLDADVPKEPGRCLFKQASPSSTIARLNPHPATIHCNRSTSSSKFDDVAGTSRAGRGRTNLHGALNIGIPGEGSTTQNGYMNSSSNEADSEGSHILGGLKQRLLSFIFRSIWHQNIDPMTKTQCLKRFYYHFQHYVDLVIWKVQFLDRYHLLIKFGSADCVMSRNSETSHQPAFFAIYNLESTEILGFYQNSSEEFLELYEKFCDHFRAIAPNPLYMRFISSMSNNLSSREQLRQQKTACNSGKSGCYVQVVKRTLALLPYSSQSLSPSPYFDQSLFQFDEKLISATDRHRPCMEHPIKFISKSRPTLKFKINPGPELNVGDGHVKRVVSFIFHPSLPFAISVQQSLIQPPVVNFHSRR